MLASFSDGKMDDLIKSIRATLCNEALLRADGSETQDDQQWILIDVRSGRWTTHNIALERVLEILIQTRDDVRDYLHEQEKQ